MENQSFQSYRDLRVWQEGMNLAQMCYQITKHFPKEEIYGLTAQIRRAAVSIPANIAEGHGRETRGQFVQFLRVAQGSLKELETHLILATRVDLLTGEENNQLLTQCEMLGKMLRSLLRSLESK